MATVTCLEPSLSALSPELLAVLDDVATAFRAASPMTDLESGETDIVVEVTTRVLTPSGRWTGRWRSRRLRRRVRDRIRHDPEAIDLLIDSGWLVRWTPTDSEAWCVGPWAPDDLTGVECVTLSPWAADRLGVEIVEVGSCRRARWGKAQHLIDDLDGDYPPSVLPSWADLPDPGKSGDEGAFYVFGKPPITDEVTLAGIPDTHADEPGEAEDGAGGDERSELPPLKWALPTGGNGLLGGLDAKHPK